MNDINKALEFLKEKGIARKFNPDQPRDEKGQWTHSGTTANGNPYTLTGDLGRGDVKVEIDNAKVGKLQGRVTSFVPAGESNYRDLITRNASASIGFTLATKAVYASKYKTICDVEEVGTEEWKQIARDLKAKYGENLTTDEVLQEMERQ
jgi:hypothetical protein